jgi:hypothetical protein
MKKTFSTSAFRSFKIFIGELTAVAAGIYVGIQEAIPIIDTQGKPDPWEVTAKKHGLMLRGLKSERILNSAIRLNIVSLYSGFDLFVSDIRGQFYELHGKEWRHYDGDTPFQELARNTPSTNQELEKKLGRDRIVALAYYRLVRNAIAHPKDEAIAAARRFFADADNGNCLSKVTSDYGMKSVPSQIESLSFHDLKLLARVALDVAAAVDEDFDPGDERLAKLLPSNVLKPPKSAERIHNARKGWLSVNYGIQSERAERIISIHKTHQLGG